MGLFGAICSFVSGAVNAVSNALGSVTGSIGGMAVNALKVASPWLGTIANVVSAVAQALGVFKKEDDIEELGAKAMQSDKKPEDFNNHTEYIEHLRNDIKLDREKFEKAGGVEKLARTAVGASIAMKGINEKKGFDIPIETWVAIGKIGLDETKVKEIDTLLDTLKDGKFEDFAKYVDGKLEGIDKKEQMSNTLSDMYNELEPNASRDEIEQKIMDMRVGDIKPEDIKK